MCVTKQSRMQFIFLEAKHSSGDSYEMQGLFMIIHKNETDTTTKQLGSALN